MTDKPISTRHLNRWLPAAVPRGSDTLYYPCIDGHSEDTFTFKWNMGQVDECCRRCGQSLRRTREPFNPNWVFPDYEIDP